MVLFIVCIVWKHYYLIISIEMVLFIVCIGWKHYYSTISTFAVLLLKSWDENFIISNFYLCDSIVKNLREWWEICTGAGFTHSLYYFIEANFDFSLIKYSRNPSKHYLHLILLMKRESMLIDKMWCEKIKEKNF